MIDNPDVEEIGDRLEILEINRLPTQEWVILQIPQTASKLQELDIYKKFYKVNQNKLPSQQDQKNELTSDSIGTNNTRK